MLVLAGAIPSGTLAATGPWPGVATEPAAKARFAEGTISVRFPSLLDGATVDAFAKSRNLTEERYAPETGWYRYRIEDGKAAEDKAAELSGNVMISEAIPIPLGEYTVFPTTPPNDPKWPSQWGLVRTEVQQAWQIAGGGSSNHAVAIIDSGVDLDHPDLGIIVGHSFEPGHPGFGDICASPGHGTQVAGIAAAFTNNGKAIAGVA